MSTHSLYATLTGKIARVRRAEHWLAVQSGLINAVAGVMAVWTLAGILEMIGRFDVPGRTGIFWGASLLSLFVIARVLAMPIARLFGLARGADDDTIARRVGDHIPTIGDRLINTLQLYRRTNDGGAIAVSPELIEAAIVAQGSTLVDHDYSVILEKENRRRAVLLLFSALLLLGGLLFAFGDSLTDAFNRLADHNTHYVKPAPFTLSVEPGDVTAIRGDSVEIMVRASGIPPRMAVLTLREEEADGDDRIELREEKPGVWTYMVPNVRRTTRYQAEAAGVSTPEHTITVVERPELLSLRVTVTPPRYTGRRSETLPDGSGDVSGLRGTTISVVAATTGNVEKANVVQLFPKGGTRPVVAGAATGSLGEATIREGGAADAPHDYDTVRIPMRVEEESVRGSFALRRNGEYYVELISASGLANPSPVHYTMSVSNDASPSIALTQPSGDVDISESMLLPTQLRISDDYGFSRLRVMYRLVASEYEKPWTEFREMRIPIPKGASVGGIDVPYLWDLSGERLVPEDELEIYFEVFDNDVVAGPKSARTGVMKVRFPSFEEMLREAEQIAERTEDNLEEMLREANDTRQKMEEIDRELMKQLANRQSEASWQEQKKLEELMKEHEAMEKRMEQMADDLRTMAEKLQEAKAISPETLKEYEDLQKLMEEVSTPEMRRSMENLQKEMQKMTPEQVAEAMREYKFNEEQFRQAIERTKKILERMRTGQKIDELESRAEHLAEQQEQLNEEAARAKNDAERRELAERQEELAKEAEAMAQEAKELAEQMKQNADMPAEQMEKANRQLEQSDPAGQMRQGAQQMRKGNRQEARQQGEEAQQSMEQFGQQMQKLGDEMRRNEQRQVLNKMKKSLKDLLDMSKRQEELKERTGQAPPNSPSYSELAREQAQLNQDMRNLANDLADVGEKSFSVTPEMGRELGDAMKEMGKAQGSLEQKNGHDAEGEQGEAMEGMNRAAMMMGESIARMQNPEGQQGQGMSMESFRQRLGQAAAQQQMINMAMQQQMGEGQQGQGQQGQQGEGEGEGEGENGQKSGAGAKGQGGEENGGEGGNARRLTQRQQEVKKSLDDLNREAKELAGTKKDRLGDLAQASREIEEVLRDMESGRVSGETLRRQERILSRMLDAMKSQHERDLDKERESRAGVDVARSGPAELPFDKDEDLFRQLRDQLQGGTQGYSPDFEQLIRTYMESIGK